jgi:oxygen-independent coproporphyrinogen-3 oxidase
MPAREARAHSPLGVLHDTHPRSRPLGFYLHVPFCAKRCYYCSFNTAPMDPGAMERYVRAVRRELELLAQLPWAREVTLASVFLGGGTPSLLEADELRVILDDLHARFAVEPGAEVTVECNPESVDRAKLEGYRAAGVNRISLGVQALDDAILPQLGRLHSAGQARAAFDGAREAGHDNVSVDVMYGLPGLDVAGWARAVQAVLDWQPDHLSAYGLTLDAGSLWGVTGVAGLPPEGAVVEQYWALARAAAERGFEHYEISNYARPGLRSRHNLTYWRAAEYLAAGPGACGFIGATRYGNTKPVPRYCATLEAGALPIDTSESLTGRQRLAEQLILGLRTHDGIPRSLLEERLAADPRLRTRTDAWRDAGLLTDRGDNVALTESGFLVSDTLFIELL